MDCNHIKRINTTQDNIQRPDFDINQAEELITSSFNMVDTKRF
jgi:hypothetical protein